MIPRVDLKQYRVTKGQWGGTDIESLIQIFKGRISKRSTTAFVNGKLTSAIVPLLMCDYDIEFLAHDIIEDLDGERYLVTEPRQPNGVAGVKPVTFKARQVITLMQVNG